MSAPLRKLEHVIAEVRSGRFDPDGTRSGYFPGAAASSQQEDQHADEPKVIEDADSVSSAGSSETEGATDDEAVESPSDTVVVKNIRTCVFHLADGKDVLRCGKSWPQKAEQYRDVPAGGVLCTRCF